MKAKPTTNLPKKLWVQIYGEGIDKIAAYEIDPREVHDNGKPIYQYAHLTPIQEAINEIEKYNDHLEGEKIMIVSVSDWQRLVKLIKEEV
jgi:hypothetical protein